MESVVGMAEMRSAFRICVKDVTGTERYEDLVCTYVDNVNFK